MIFKTIRRSKLARSLLVFLILVFINLSIDAPDIFSKTIAYNEQETLIELIVEVGLGFNDYIAENDHDNEMPEKSSSKKISLDLHQNSIDDNDFNLKLIATERLSIGYFKLNHSQKHSKIIIPPPELSV